MSTYPTAADVTALDRVEHPQDYHDGARGDARKRRAEDERLTRALESARAAREADEDQAREWLARADAAEAEVERLTADLAYTETDARELEADLARMTRARDEWRGKALYRGARVLRDIADGERDQHNTGGLA